MKIKYLLCIVILLATGGSLFAQNPTNVTGTLTDPSSVAYYPAQVTACLTPVTIDPTVGGKHVNPNIGANYCVGPVQTAPSGAFSMALYANGNIVPGATQWIFTVQTAGSGPPAGKGAQTFSSAAVTISGSSQDVSTNLNSVGPAQLNSGSSSSSSPVNSQFFISNVACGGATNCLQMVDDDSTDNCGAALTTWLGLVNAYAGPGKPQVTIYGSGAGKAYKLATANCELAFTSTKGADVHLLATIDCAQSGQDCIRFGANGNVVSIVGQDYSLDGTGVLYGGASLTTGCSQACAGILVKAGTNNFYIHGTQFGGPLGGTTGSGFGANATPPACTNYLIYVENPVATGVVQHTKGAVTSSTSTSGGCGYANPNGATAGTNTVKFVNNIIGTLGFSGGSGACGSIGIVDGGSYGTSGDNVIYGFGMPIRVQGQGHIIRHNEIDNAQCAASGLTAAINVGAAGSGTAVPGMNVDGNIVQGGATHTLDLLAIAGDSTATITGASLVNNQTSGSSTANLTHANTSCTPNVSQGNQCWISGNINMNNTLSSGNALGIGWSNGLALAGINSQANLGANLGSTILVRAPTTRTYMAWCEVIETTRDAVSSTLPSCQFIYTDAISGAALTRTVSAVNTGNLVGTIGDGFITMVVTGGTDINYSTTGYLSNTASAMKYTVAGFIATY